jgi:predicted DNA-binding antitoxin AbrB/MazE fold protein
MRPVEARYEDGFLKPAKALQLRPGEKVGVIVVRHPDPSRWDFKRLAQGATEDAALAGAGLDAWADALEAEDRR